MKLEGSNLARDLLWPYRATAPRFGPLVIKIIWPTSSRVLETEFTTKAIDMAKGEHAWATNHLPKVHYSEDVVFEAGSTLEPVAGLFENAVFVIGNYACEPCILRPIIQERLYPLKSLTNVRDVGRIFLGVVCSMCIYALSVLTIHLPQFSSSLALQPHRHPPSRPLFQQHFVSPLQGQSLRHSHHHVLSLGILPPQTSPVPTTKPLETSCWVETRVTAGWEAETWKCSERCWSC